MSKTNISSSGSRILRVLKALRGHALNGISNGELASALGESPANINRALNTLIDEGLARLGQDGREIGGADMFGCIDAKAVDAKAGEGLEIGGNLPLHIDGASIQIRQAAKATGLHLGAAALVAA